MVSGTHESPALGKIYRFLEVFNTGDPAQFQHFADEHYAKRSGRDLVAFLQLVHHDAGPLELVRLDEVA